MQNAKAVTYVGDDGDHFALVTADNGDKADLLVWTGGDGWQAHDDVPRREKNAENDKLGYGVTWH